MANRFVISNGELLSKKYAARAELMPSEMRALARDTGDFVVDAAKGFLDRHSRTGRLRRGIRRSGVTRTGPDTWTVSVGSRGASERYARFVEYGTGMHIDRRVGTPHLIFPKTATAMVWTDRSPFAIPYRGNGITSFNVRGGYKTVAQFTRGQKPVYFMRNAFRLADRTYVPGRLSVLGRKLTR